MRLLPALGRLFRRRASPAMASPCDACPLAACASGSHATVLCIACPAHDAQRLRTLGLFEGAKVGIVDARGGIVLDVRGSRLALGDAIVAAITVRPLRA
jgi:Fe2+ transport system protein FeoA